MIGKRNLAPDRGPNVWTRTAGPERDEQAPGRRWRDGIGGVAMAAAGAALVAAGGSRVYRALQARHAPGDETAPGLAGEPDAVGLESAASFPASDSPSWTVRGVSPRETASMRRASPSTRASLGGSGGIHLVEEVLIRRPVADVYRFWRDLTNLPKFMRHLQSVTTDGRRSHWVVRGPLGTAVEWDAEINNVVENKVIGWQTLAEATVTHAGSVTFDEAPGGTRVRVKLQYDPPAGRVGGAVAKLLGEDPAKQIREDLQRVKELLEYV